MNLSIKIRGWGKASLAGVTLIPLLVVGINCSGLGKKKSSFKTSEESRKVASLAPPGEYHSRRAPKSKKDLLSMMKAGEAVISKAVYIKNEKPVCFMDTKGKRRLVPEFAHPISGPSSVRFKKEFPMCGNNVENHIASLTPNLLAEGEQVAWVGHAGAAMLGCVFALPIRSYMTNRLKQAERNIEYAIKHGSKSDIEWHIAMYQIALFPDMIGVAASSAFGALVGNIDYSKYVDRLDRLKDKMTKGKGVYGIGAGARAGVGVAFTAMGITAGILGYVICGKAVAYIVEALDNPLETNL